MKKVFTQKKEMEDDPSEPTPQPEYAEPKKRAPRKKPDLSNVEPAAVTIRTKSGEKTFSARSRPKTSAPPEPARPTNPWESVLSSWLD